MSLSLNQLHILRHALGLLENGSGKSYRNHFVTGEGSTDYPDCIALVGQGLMKRSVGNALSGGMDVFHVTDEGRAMMLDEAAHTHLPPAQAVEATLREIHEALVRLMARLPHYCDDDEAPLYVAAQERARAAIAKADAFLSTPTGDSK